ncbi:MAG: hypothetical protein ACJ8J0_16080 [Longimicrobiaceae bacterium]
MAAVDLDEAGLASVARECAGVAGRVETFAADVSDEAAVRGFVREAGEWLGGINVGRWSSRRSASAWRGSRRG